MAGGVPRQRHRMSGSRRTHSRLYVADSYREGFDSHSGAADAAQDPCRLHRGLLAVPLAPLTHPAPLRGHMRRDAFRRDPDSGAADAAPPLAFLSGGRSLCARTPGYRLAAAPRHRIQPLHVGVDRTAQPSEGPNSTAPLRGRPPALSRGLLPLARYAGTCPLRGHYIPETSKLQLPATRALRSRVKARHEMASMFPSTSISCTGIPSVPRGSRISLAFPTTTIRTRSGSRYFRATRSMSSLVTFPMFSR